MWLRVVACAALRQLPGCAVPQSSWLKSVGFRLAACCPGLCEHVSTQRCLCGVDCMLLLGLQQLGRTRAITWEVGCLVCRGGGVGRGLVPYRRAPHPCLINVCGTEPCKKQGIFSVALSAVARSLSTAANADLAVAVLLCAAGSTLFVQAALFVRPVAGLTNYDWGDWCLGSQRWASVGQVGGVELGVCARCCSVVSLPCGC